MRKLPVILITALLAILIITTLARALPSEADVKNKAVWMKAICSGNYCIDVKITCVNGELIDIEPVPEGVYFSGDWEDPRPEEFKNKWCEYPS